MTRTAPAGPDLPEPVFILAAPRSQSSVTSAMLGQHPQLYGLPETHLFGDDTMEQWWTRCSRETFAMTHGLLRAVAELCHGEQTESSVRQAAGWLRRRAGHSTGLVFEELAVRAAPLALVDKSPNLVYNTASMRRALAFFPHARFVHLVRHPRSYCASVLGYRELLSAPEYAYGAEPGRADTTPKWIKDLASFPFVPPARPDAPSLPANDPQGGWFVLNDNAATFVASLPPGQAVTVRGEDVVGDPRRAMTDLAAWLGLRTDDEAIEQTLHPECSPFAGFGPLGARLGNDILFLQRPQLRPGRGSEHDLEGPLPWRSDGGAFLPEVVELARRLGYS